jgi:predicted house-cleaning noncanonical NTP pyrophosphatase (MazG superfamily)
MGNAKDEEMKKIYYRKLVRDKIPKRISQSGGKYAVKTLSVPSFKKELLKKVEEEAGGLANAKVKSEIVAETGDLLDVLGEVKKAFRITSDELTKSRTKEMKRKGGFGKRLYLLWAEDTGYRSNEKKGKNESSSR